MFNFPIRALNHYAAVVDNLWLPTTWKLVQAELNPWNDPFIDRLNLLAFNLRRAILMRSEPYLSLDLHTLDDIEESIIDMERETYIDELCRVMAIHRMYIHDHYYQAEAESYRDKPWPKFTRNDFDTTQIPKMYLDDAKTWQLIPDHLGFSNLHVKREHVEKHSTRHWYTSNEAEIMGRQTRREWQEVGPSESLISAHYRHLLYEFGVASDDANHLSGASSKSRWLYVNEAIPIPNRYTILAWFDLCGLELSSLSVTQMQKAAILTGADVPPDLLLSYVLPSLPMTSEHVNGSSLPGDDSQSDHSLPAKSAGHDRSDYGRIIHGRWEASSVLLDVTASLDGFVRGFNPILDSIRNGFVTGRELADHFWQLWGVHRGWHNEARVIHTNRYTRSCVFDPLLSYMHPLESQFHLNNRRAFDTGMRSLGKFNRVHLRFGEDEFGGLCAEEWRQGFEKELLRYLQSNHNQRTVDLFDAALIRQTDRGAFTVPPKKRGRPRKDPAYDKFNIAGIFGTDSPDE